MYTQQTFIARIVDGLNLVLERSRNHFKGAIPN